MLLCLEHFFVSLTACLAFYHIAPDILFQKTIIIVDLILLHKLTNVSNMQRSESLI